MQLSARISFVAVSTRAGCGAHACSAVFQRFVRSGSDVCDFWRNRIIDWKDDDADRVGHLDISVFEDAFKGFDYAQGQDAVPRL